ncbi:MAG: hypothetical protein ACI9VR_000283 [Cognaticolwellia sp.]|jgi:hypothetical protein
MFWTLIIACGEPASPPPPPRQVSSALSAALEAVSGTPDVTPKEGEPPPMPPASREAPKATEPEAGPCRDAHEVLEAYNERIAGVQATVARAGNLANQAAGDMSACVYDEDCSSDGRRAEALKKDLADKEEKAAQAANALGPMDAKLFELNQIKSAACSSTTVRPGR